MAKPFFVFILTIMASVMISATAFAAASPGSTMTTGALGGFALTPTYGGYFFDSREPWRSGQGFGLKIGYDSMRKSFVENFGVEGTFNQFTTTVKSTGDDAKAYLFRLDAIYPFIVKNKWVPFLAVGGGVIGLDDTITVKRTPIFNYGGGLKYFFQNYLAIRLDVRHLFAYKNANTADNYEAGIGLSYYFGKERPKKIVPPPVSKAVSKMPALDDILKSDEQTPVDETDVSVDEALLPDPDPVKLDNPATTVGKKSIGELTVEFAVNSAVVQTVYLENLKKFADIIKGSPDATVIIEGHTDPSGEMSHNNQLSEQRAENIRNSLIQLGVDSARISAFGFGSAKPVADNSIVDGRQKNRRAVTTVIVPVYEQK
ncbi:MAG: OmpA family protein [Desulfuromonadaceae bacterium]|nr:OmpA family protein [Desulfuromonadaceae bacterium]MDD5107701.1 OmpA family protein [Desulfuromonadaceae bacterium]